MYDFIEEINNLNRQVINLYSIGNFQQAFNTAYQAVELAENNQITEHTAYCDSLNNLAELYRIQSNYSQAELIYEKALDCRKRLLSPKHPDVAENLNNLATLYYSQGRYSQAETKYLEAFELWKACFGLQHSQTATCLSNIAEIYFYQGHYTKAEKLHLEVLEIRKSLFREEHPQVFQTLTNLAAIYEAQGRYLLAEQTYLSTIEKQENLLGDEHPDTVFSLNNLAALYDSQGKYIKAEHLYLKVLPLITKLFGEQHPHTATTLNNLGQAYFYQGRYFEAEQKHLAAYAIRKQIFGSQHLDIAQSLNNLAEIYREQGRYFAAENNHQEAYSIRKRLLGENHPDIASSLNNLAVTYTHQGKYTKAEEIHLTALAMVKRLLGNEHLEVATSLSNLASLYQIQGSYSAAEQKYDEAYRIQKNLLGEKHPDIARILTKIASLYQQQGRYSEAEENYHQAYQIQKMQLGENHPDVAASLNNLATLYYSQFNYLKAESSLKESLKITHNIFGNQHPDVVNCMNNLAVIYGCQQRYNQAEQLHLEILEIKKRLLGEEHPNIALSLNNLAEIYFFQGRYQQAEEEYLAALSLRKRLLGEEHPHVARSLNNLATILTARQRPEESLTYRIQAGLINDKLINQAFAFSSENDRLVILAKLRNNLDLFLSLVYQHLSHSQTALQQALDFVLKRKALTASVLAAQNEALYSKRYPHLQEQFRQLSDLNARLVNLTFTIPSNGNFKNYQNELLQLQKQYNKLQKQLASQVPEVQLFEQIVDRIQVASKLPQDSILIEFVRFDEFDFCAVESSGEQQWKPPRYLAFILPAHQPDAVQMIDLGEAEIIDKLIQDFRKEVSDNSFESLAWGKKAAKLPKLQIKSYNPTAAIKLSQALFKPIHNAVKNCNYLIFAPDGNLNLLPFELLTIDHTGTHLVIDEYIVSYLSVGRDILRSQVKTTGSCDVPLIIADPDFDLAGNNALPKQPLNEEIINTLDDNSLSPIPETRIFAQSIAQKLKNAKLYLGAEAISTHLTNNKCPKVIAIATHGLFLPDSSKQPPILKHEGLSNNLLNFKPKNPMMRSILALAGATTRITGGNLPPSAGFGLVSAQDIASLDLWNNELTVLSACDTARGDIKIGEGVFGLRRAFAVAGTKNLVMSLWKVPAKATPLLMENFFDNLQLNMQPTQALQQAQQYIRNITVKELRQSVLGIAVLKELSGATELAEQTKLDCHENDKPLNHPFYWGAWICQGVAAVQV
ncbi:MAG: CHAT domain-containing protein [Richelia sp. RM2_1_2]|nr:CHAT domain-containing protein [Richelia sp. RM1_1_1]NJO64089.1 CHAT domain-containing protein [Richelia sp. RM2_1_2]